jgi:hypothetical protein
MRLKQIFLPALIAFATAACARQQASYYVIDPATQQPVQVAQQATPAPNAQPYYAQAGYQPPPAQRGLFSTAQPQYAQVGYQQPPAQNGRGLFSSAQPQAYGQAPSPPLYPQAAAPQQPPNGRGLFNTYAQAAPIDAQQAYALQPAAPAYGQPIYAAPSAPAAYATPPAPPQYRPPSYGPYAAAPQANPFLQARWY